MDLKKMLALKKTKVKDRHGLTRGQKLISPPINFFSMKIYITQRVSKLNTLNGLHNDDKCLCVTHVHNITWPIS